MLEYLWYLDLPDRFHDDELLDPAWEEFVDEEEPRTCGMGCGSVRPEFYGEPIDIKVTHTPTGHIQFAPMALIISEQLAEIVRPHLKGTVYGRCIDAKTDDALDTHMTVYTPIDQCTETRGDAKTVYRTCPTCGKVIISRMFGSQRRHVNAKTVPAGCVAIQHGGHGSIFVSDRLVEPVKAIGGGLELLRYEVK